jgi:phenylpropionate dioxygenase-like ring-hydroxylating dioxygenase large terminal subunit
MVPNQWYVILESAEIKRGQVKAFLRMGEKMVAWRNNEGVLGIFRDRCPHRGVQLSLGKVHNDHLQCPFHGLEFDPAGKCVLIPANGASVPVPERYASHAFPVAELHGFVYIFWAPDTNTKTLFELSKSVNPVYFEDVDDTFLQETVQDPWNANYSRAIENQLDVVHLPFIHHNTIGKGNATIVDGPYIEATPTQIAVYPTNRREDGKPALRMDEVKKPEQKRTYIKFLFPNLWQNHISDTYRIIIAFAPVDETHSILYMRTYQKMVKIPGISKLFFIFSNWFGKVVAHQDRRVVITHQPQPTQLRMDEVLVAGDYPIVLYRKMKEEKAAAVNGSGLPSYTDK